MPGVNRNYTLTDVLQGIYSTATGVTAGVSNTTPGSTISLVGEADEVLSLEDSVTGVTGVSKGWDQEVWGAIGWQ
jgi:hypothetical protein